MKAQINFITLAVANLQRSLKFYRDGLALPTKGIQSGHEDHVLFDLENGFSLVLYDQQEFVKFTTDPNQRVNSAGFILSSLADSKEEVDNILKQALNAGASQVGMISDQPWGYSASFTDPDGHQWEITFMPGYK